MKYPTFAHGKLASVQAAIENGKISYPAYCWIDDTDQYSFLNKDGELEIVGIPKLVGTLDNEVVLSALDDGVYQIKGQHKITATDETTFLSASFILTIVQTIDGVKKIRRITADDLTTYSIEDDLTVKKTEVATKNYLDEQGYIKQDDLDDKIAILKSELEDEISSYIDEAIEGKVEPIVNRVIDENLQSIDDNEIQSLFN